MKKFLMMTAAFALLSTTAAEAKYTVLKSKGNWMAFHVAKSHAGNPMCGMMTYGLANGKVTASTHIKYHPGMGLVVQLFKTGWQVPEGTKINTTVQFDNGEVFPGEATVEITTDGSVMLSTNVAEGKYLDFMGLVAAANELKISFPDGNEPTWKWKMGGSREVTNAFIQCNIALDKSVSTQPTGKSQPVVKKDDGSI